MIQKKTVFVLGAGASMPYGFPSGKELVDKIIAVAPRMIDLSEGIFSQHYQPHWEEFAEALAKSSIRSIDRFLELRPKFAELGNAAIAFVLLRYEKESNLFRNPNRGAWYSYLLERMESAISSESESMITLEGFSENQLRVVTYNYDRSLEQFLFTALCQRYETTNEILKAHLRKLRIIHVYGQLGKLGWQTDDSDSVVEYGDISRVVAALHGIKLIGDRTTIRQPFIQAHNLIMWADRVYFLGFGYDHENMRRLELPVQKADGSPSDRWVPLRGTALGFTEMEKNKLMHKYRFKPGGPSLELGNLDHDILTFLRHDADFNMND